MSKLPKMPYKSGIGKLTQVQFGGLRHHINCGDGELFDMENLSAENYPYITLRKKRGRYIPVSSDAKQIYADNGVMLIISESGITYNGIKLMDSVSPETAELVRFGDRVVLMPDKKVINLKYKIIGFFHDIAEISESGVQETVQIYDGAAIPDAMTDELHLFVWNGKIWADNGRLVEDMEAVTVNQQAVFMDGLLYNEKATANTIMLQDISEFELKQTYGFRSGDAVKISGCDKVYRNNKTAIIREIAPVDEYFKNGVYLRFSDFCFDMPTKEDGSEETQYTEDQITIQRTVPEMDVLFEHENRLWGAKGKEIFASKLGDPFNWNCFDGLSTDSYYLHTQDMGEITAGISYGYPRFFREDSLKTIYGSVPSAFQTQTTRILGVKKGEKKSLACIGGAMLWLSNAGIVLYDGDKTYLQDQVFGDWKLSKVISQAGAEKCYVCADIGPHPLADGERMLATFCFDATNGIWTKEDNTGIKSMTYMDGIVYALTDQYILTMNGDGGNKEDEGSVAFFAEFGDFTDGSQNRKAVSKIQLRIEIEEGAYVIVKIRYDSSGEWTTVKQIEQGKKRSVYIPVIPHRCDHYRIRIEGAGGCTLYSMAREIYVGSAVH